MKQNRRQGQEAALTGPAGVEPRPPGRSLGSWGGAKGTGAVNAGHVLERAVFCQ